MLRFDPFRDLDRMTEQITRGSRSMLAMDAVRADDEITIYIDAPGATTDDIDVSIERNELTVSVDRVWNDDDKEVLARERPQGTFSRRFILNDALDLEELKAKTENGVLTLSIPVAERSKPRRIDVSDGSRSEAIEATSTSDNE
ncbi:MAG: Hsp20/alpha crystallin family protein [Ilumatobacteraceae bacterium]|nr:Hsp20/alpha crystallin family protein [Ilumatobacteraceae bacterium]